MTAPEQNPPQPVEGFPNTIAEYKVRSAKTLDDMNVLLDEMTALGWVPIWPVTSDNNKLLLPFWRHRKHDDTTRF